MYDNKSTTLCRSRSLLLYFASNAVCCYCCVVGTGLIQSSHREVEKVEEVVSWETVVERYIALQGGQADSSDHTPFPAL